MLWKDWQKIWDDISDDIWLLGCGRGEFWPGYSAKVQDMLVLELQLHLYLSVDNMIDPVTEAKRIFFPAQAFVWVNLFCIEF